MRNSLVKSVFFVILFWWVILFIWWSLLADPAINYRHMLAMEELLPFVQFPQFDKVTVFQAWDIQKMVLITWTVPIFLLAGISAVVGILFVWLWGRTQEQNREKRETQAGNWKGISISLGIMPQPVQLRREELDIQADSTLAKFSQEQLSVMSEIMGVLATQTIVLPEMEGHSLFEHTEKLLLAAISNPNYQPLSVLMLLATEIGKAKAYLALPDGSFELIKSIDKEASKELALLPSFMKLPLEERLPLGLAVKYRTNPALLPDIEPSGKVKKEAIAIILQVKKMQEQPKPEIVVPVVEEKPKSLKESIEIAFIDILATLPFQTPGLARKVTASGWKKGNRVYLLEMHIREKILNKLSKSFIDQVTPKKKQMVHPLTLELLQVFDEKKWLIKKVGELKLATAEALWKVQAGKLAFKGVIALDLPEELLERLPSQDTPYPVEVIGPSYEQPGTMSTVGVDLGDILTATKKKS